MCHRSTPKEVENIMGALYFCTFFLGIVMTLSVQPVFSAERTVFYRERTAHMYSVLPYALSLVDLALHVLCMPQHEACEPLSCVVPCLLCPAAV